MSSVNIYEWPELYETAIDETSKKYIFISYSHEDTDIVYQDLKTLSTNGARLWYDKAMHIGQNWVERAKKKIFDDNCAAVLFYVSENSLKSSAFLQELEYAIQRAEHDNSFSYMSVNIGGVSAFEILKKLEISEDAFLKILLAFNEKKLFIPRKRDPFDTDHILKMVEVFEETDSIDSSKCTINKTTLFDFAEYERDLQIVRYRGSDSIVNIPALNNGRKIVAIGINAFKNNTSVKRINVPEGVRMVDDFAFSGCRNLESITLPNSLLTLGYESFRDCSNLGEIVIPYNVEQLGDYCFYKCHRLSTITLLSVTPLKIGFAAFSECHAIESILLPETLAEIGPYAFNNCINICKLIIPASVRKIGLSAFYNCSSLSSVVFETNHILNNNRWFARCRNLKEITFSAGNMSQYLNNASWEDHKDKLLFKLSVPAKISFESGILNWDNVTAADYYIVRVNDVRYESSRPFFRVPQYEETSNLFVSVEACSYDERIVNSDASSEIQVKTSTDIYEITTTEEDKILTAYNGTMLIVKIPDGVTVIGEDAFYNHEELREVVFPSSLKRIGNRAFYHCKNLQRFHFPENLVEIGDEAFWGVAIQDLTIPASVQAIGKSCFACCNNLIELNILTSHFAAGDKVFYRCIKLKKANLPDELDELYEGIFRGCTELEDIVLPSRLKTIRFGAISYVMRLQRLIIPKSVRLIEEQAFSNSFALTDIFVDDENEYYFDKNGILFSKEDNCLVHYPADKRFSLYAVDDSISKICNYAFMDAEHLEHVVIGKGVCEIGKSAFERCPSLKDVVITGELEHIRANAFKDCISMDCLYLLSGLVPEIESGVFDNVNSNLKIFVPEKYIKNYLRMIEWQEYHGLLHTIDEKQISFLI